MDISKLNGPQRITAVGGITLLVASFLPWYSVIGFGISGWNAGAMAVIGIIIGLAAAGLLIYAALADRDLDIGPLAAPQASLIGAAVSAALIGLRLVTALSVVSIGLILGVAGAGAILFGTYRAVVAAGLDVPFVDAVSNSKEK